MGCVCYCGSRNRSILAAPSTEKGIVRFEEPKTGRRRSFTGRAHISPAAVGAADRGLKPQNVGTIGVNRSGTMFMRTGEMSPARLTLQLQ